MANHLQLLLLLLFNHEYIWSPSRQYLNYSNCPRTASCSATINWLVDFENWKHRVSYSHRGSERPLEINGGFTSLPLSLASWEDGYLFHHLSIDYSLDSSNAPLINWRWHIWGSTDTAPNRTEPPVIGSLGYSQPAITPACNERSPPINSRGPHTNR